MKKGLIFIGAGMLLLVTSGLVYIPKFINQGLLGIELTFLSNFVAGLILIFDGLRQMRKKKQVNQGYYLAMDSILICVLMICLLCLGEANFSGAFLFLHILNPIIVTVLVIGFTYQGPLNLYKTFIYTIVVAMLYMVYAIVYGYMSGDWLYSVINVPEKGIYKVIMFAVISFSCIPILEYAVYKCSKRIREKR